MAVGESVDGSKIGSEVDDGAIEACNTGVADGVLVGVIGTGSLVGLETGVGSGDGSGAIEGADSVWPCDEPPEISSAIVGATIVTKIEKINKAESLETVLVNLFSA